LIGKQLVEVDLENLVMLYLMLLRMNGNLLRKVLKLGGIDGKQILFINLFGVL
jgi:hypothetical protein